MAAAFNIIFSTFFSIFSHLSLHNKVPLTANLNSAKIIYTLWSEYRIISCTVSNWWREHKPCEWFCVEGCHLGDSCRTEVQCSYWCDFLQPTNCLQFFSHCHCIFLCSSVFVTDSWYIHTLFFRTVCGVLQAWMQPTNISQWLCIIITHHGGLKR